MSEPNKSLPQEQEAKTDAADSPRPRSGQQRKRQRSVIHYITILFAAAFVLLLMTYVMDRRQNEQVINGLTQSVSGLRESLSNIQSTQDIYDENVALLEKIDQLEDKLNSLEQDQVALQRELTLALAEQSHRAKQVQAMDWFWQINEAYVRGRRTAARGLIEQMEEQALAPYLPQESVTDNGRFSPADRYQEIYQALF